MKLSIAVFCLVMLGGYGITSLVDGKNVIARARRGVAFPDADSSVAVAQAQASLTQADDQGLFFFPLINTFYLKFSLFVIFIHSFVISIIVHYSILVKKRSKYMNLVNTNKSSGNKQGPINSCNKICF